MYKLRSHSIEKVVLGHNRLEYVGAALLIGLGTASLIQSLRMMPHGHYSILGAAALILVATGILLFLQRRRQASALIFDNQSQALLFKHQRHEPVPISYSRIKHFEVSHLRLGNHDTWALGAQFQDGTMLPLLCGKESRMRLRLRDFNQWVFLETGTPAQAPELPPLPAWMSWQEADGRLRCHWKSRLPWSEILLRTAFILGLAIICYRAADPTEMPAFWIFCGFSAVLGLGALTLLFHGIRTREKTWWLSWDRSSLSWGNRNFGRKRERELGSLQDAHPVQLYCSFSEARLTALNANGEKDLRRKTRLNPTFALSRVLHMVKGNQRLEIELQGFRMDEMLLLQEHLARWEASQNEARPGLDLSRMQVLQPGQKPQP